MRYIMKGKYLKAHVADTLQPLRNIQTIANSIYDKTIGNRLFVSATEAITALVEYLQDGYELAIADLQESDSGDKKEVAEFWLDRLPKREEIRYVNAELRDCYNSNQLLDISEQFYTEVIQIIQLESGKSKMCDLDDWAHTHPEEVIANAWFDNNLWESYAQFTGKDEYGE